MDGGTGPAALGRHPSGTAQEPIGTGKSPQGTLFGAKDRTRKAGPGENRNAAGITSPRLVSIF